VIAPFYTPEPDGEPNDRLWVVLLVYLTILAIGGLWYTDTAVVLRAFIWSALTAR